MDDAQVVVVGVATLFTVHPQSGEERRAREECPRRLSEEGVVVVARFATPVGNRFTVVLEPAAKDAHQVFVRVVRPCQIVEVVVPVGGQAELLTEGVDGEPPALQESTVQLHEARGRAGACRVGIGERRKVLQHVRVRRVVVSQVVEVILVYACDSEQGDVAKVIGDMGREADVFLIRLRHLVDRHGGVVRAGIHTRDSESLG